MTHATLSNKIKKWKPIQEYMDISDIIFAKVICINGFKNILVPLKTLRRAIATWGVRGGVSPSPPRNLVFQKREME